MSAEWGQTTIQFCGRNLRPPRQLPLPVLPYKMKRTIMSDGGPGEPGLCVREPLGAPHVSWNQIRIRFSGIDKADYQAMLTASLDPWTPQSFVVTSPLGTTTYQVLFSENGLVPSLMPQRGYNDPAAYIVDVTLELLTAS